MKISFFGYHKKKVTEGLNIDQLQHWLKNYPSVTFFRKTPQPGKETGAAPATWATVTGTAKSWLDKSALQVPHESAIGYSLRTFGRAEPGSPAA